MELGFSYARDFFFRRRYGVFMKSIFSFEFKVGTLSDSVKVASQTVAASHMEGNDGHT